MSGAEEAAGAITKEEENRNTVKCMIVDVLLRSYPPPSTSRHSENGPEKPAVR